MLVSLENIAFYTPIELTKSVGPKNRKTLEGPCQVINVKS